MRLAAIDIGSNAVRLLISEVSRYRDGSLDFTKVNLVRVPLRLGFDVFETGFISTEKTRDLVETMKAFRHLMTVYKVEALRVCATSAMRDALNSREIIQTVEKQSGISIRVISGSEEAGILYETHLAEQMDRSSAYLYIDVGGGSTELTLYGQQTEVLKRSFNIGTIRLLKKQVEEESWKEMKEYIRSRIRGQGALVGIGTGGNISKLFSLSKTKAGKPLSLDTLREYYREMAPLSVPERIHRYGFREDRADVIVPALEIYISIMRWAGIEHIQVPQIGLADGLIRQLYFDQRSGQN